MEQFSYGFKFHFLSCCQLHRPDDRLLAPMNFAERWCKPLQHIYLRIKAMKEHTFTKSMIGAMRIIPEHNIFQETSLDFHRSGAELPRKKRSVPIDIGCRRTVEGRTPHWSDRAFVRGRITGNQKVLTPWSVFLNLGYLRNRIKLLGTASLFQY
jgi:hypothetical protein